jgi:phosphohistidine phosphatase
MRLLVVRHGVAERDAPSGRDEDRALTPRGRALLEEEARGLLALGLSVERLLHSPWRRAQQTAELLAPLLDAARAPQVCEHLAAPPGAELLAALRGPDAAVVGHEPWLSQLVAWLTAGQARSQVVELEKGGVAWLQGEPRPKGMLLAALLPPRVLCRLGGGSA